MMREMRSRGRIEGWELPVVNVVALVLVVASIVPVWLASRISGERGSLGRG
jgi:hypothetical protein